MVKVYLHVHADIRPHVTYIHVHVHLRTCLHVPYMEHVNRHVYRHVHYIYNMYCHLNVCQNMDLYVAYIYM